MHFVVSREAALVRQLSAMVLKTVLMAQMNSRTTVHGTVQATKRSLVLNKKSVRK
jgi:hypothetical protein